MFTGIIESLGKIKNIESKGANRIFAIHAPFLSEIKISDSIAVNGCCLTVIKKEQDIFSVEAMAETLTMTSLAKLKAGNYVNLERARRITDRWEGHIVQGHIDESAKIINLKKTSRSVMFEIEISKENSKNIVEKGSIAIEGISLTIAKIKGQKICVNIIPFTFENTNLKYKRIGDLVNIEFDIIGKYVRKYLEEERVTVKRGLL